MATETLMILSNIKLKEFKDSKGNILPTNVNKLLTFNEMKEIIESKISEIKTELIQENKEYDLEKGSIKIIITAATEDITGYIKDLESKDVNHPDVLYYNRINELNKEIEKIKNDLKDNASKAGFLKVSKQPYIRINKK